MFVMDLQPNAVKSLGLVAEPQLGCQPVTKNTKKCKSKIANANLHSAMLTQMLNYVNAS